MLRGVPVYFPAFTVVKLYYMMAGGYEVQEQWLNYSKVAGGTLHFFPLFHSLHFLDPPPFLFLPPIIPLEVGWSPSSRPGLAL